ncbi:hypothetical protein GGE67_001990 [Rhizobium leucaenae]|nr:hypothetical protein [Rhizobium leucaenae]
MTKFEQARESFTVIQDLKPAIFLLDMNILCIAQERNVLGPVLEKGLNASFPIVAVTLFMKGRHDNMP